MSKLIIMKKFLLFAIVVSSAFACMANVISDGYYRVQNAATKRYVYLLDNKGSIDAHTSQVDVQAIELYLGFTKASSDPSTVIYLQYVTSACGDEEYNIIGQGTNLHEFLNKYLCLMDGKVYDGQKTYYAYAYQGSVIRYLGDRRSDNSEEKGLASTDASGDKRLWYIIPVEASKNDEYFGIAPTLTADGKYYEPFFAGFPYDAYSAGVKFYVVSKVNPWAGVVAIKEVTGSVPSGTPVIVECSNPLATDNRLNVGATENVADVSVNLLKGVYFNNDDPIHYNRTRYDSYSMRILTVKDGKLTFETADIEFLPRNKAYLQLSGATECSVKSYEVLTEEEYELAYGAVETIETSALVDVYRIDGTLVRSGISKADVSTLGKGMYVVRSGGVSEKLIVH